MRRLFDFSILTLTFSFFGSAALATGNTDFPEKFPMLGTYKLIDKIEGDCFGINDASKQFLSIQVGSRGSTKGRLSVAKLDSTRNGRSGHLLYDVRNGYNVYGPSRRGYYSVFYVDVNSEGTQLYARQEFTRSSERNLIVEVAMVLKGDYLQVRVPQSRSSNSPTWECQFQRVN